MKQTDSDKIREGQEILAVLKEHRGGAILPIHKIKSASRKSPIFRPSTWN